MKYILVLYICSITSGQCPSSSISGWQFKTHYDCVNGGYAIAQQSFRQLEAMEEFERDYINKEKIVIKFECKEIGLKT